MNKNELKLIIKNENINLLNNVIGRYLEDYLEELPEDEIIELEKIKSYLWRAMGYEI